MIRAKKMARASPPARRRTRPRRSSGIGKCDDQAISVAIPVNKNPGTAQTVTGVKRMSQHHEKYSSRSDYASHT